MKTKTLYLILICIIIVLISSASLVFFGLSPAVIFSIIASVIILVSVLLVIILRRLLSVHQTADFHETDYEPEQHPEQYDDELPGIPESAAHAEKHHPKDDLSKLMDNFLPVFNKLLSNHANISGELEYLKNMFENEIQSPDEALSSLNDLQQSMSFHLYEIKYLKDYTELIQHDADNTFSSINKVVSIVSKVTNTADETIDLFEDSQNKLNDLLDSFSGTIDLANVVSQKSHEIGTIVKAVNDITDQTQTLSINASIVAARAGDAGKPFAVVAREVKKLAARTRQSNQSIQEIVHVMLSGIEDLVSQMQSFYDRISEQNEILSNVTQQMQGIILSMEFIHASSGSATEYAVNQTSNITKFSSITDKFIESTNVKLGQILQFIGLMETISTSFSDLFGLLSSTHSIHEDMENVLKSEEVLLQE